MAWLLFALLLWAASPFGNCELASGLEQGHDGRRLLQTLPPSPPPRPPTPPAPPMALWVDVADANLNMPMIFTENENGEQMLFYDTATSPADTVWIAYSDANVGGRLSVSALNGNRWDYYGKGLTTGRAMHLSMAFAPDGTPIVAYYEGHGPGNHSLCVQALQLEPNVNRVQWVLLGGQCIRTQLPLMLSYMSNRFLALDAQGVPFVAFHDSSSASVVKLAGNSWTAVGSTVGDVLASHPISLVVDSTGTPWVAFQAEVNTAPFLSYFTSRVLTLGMLGWREITPVPAPEQGWQLVNSVGGTDMKSADTEPTLALGSAGDICLAYVRLVLDPDNLATLASFVEVACVAVGGSALARLGNITVLAASSELVLTHPHLARNNATGTLTVAATLENGGRALATWHPAAQTWYWVGQPDFGTGVRGGLLYIEDRSVALAFTQRGHTHVVGWVLNVQENYANDPPEIITNIIINIFCHGCDVIPPLPPSPPAVRTAHEE